MPAAASCPRLPSGNSPTVFNSAMSARFVNGAWSTPVFLELSTAGINDPQVAIDGNGEALAL